MKLVGTPPELHPLKGIKPNRWNPNKMTQRELESTKAGLENDGWLISHSLLIWRTDDAGNERMVIIDGEHRYKCAKALKWKEAPMVFLDGLTEQDAKALTIKLFTRRGTPSEEPLSQLLQEMFDPSDDLEAVAMDLGFSDSELERLLGVNSGEGSDPDECENDRRACPTCGKVMPKDA